MAQCEFDQFLRSEATIKMKVLLWYVLSLAFLGKTPGTRALKVYKKNIVEGLDLLSI